MKKLKMAMTVIITVLFFCIFTTGCSDDTPDGHLPGNSVNPQGKLIILQAYGSSSDAAGVSHSFVELYNISDNAINLDGISLYYADGTTVASGTNNATADGAWTRISLDKKTIPAKGSFLILGPRQNENTTGSNVARYQIPDGSGDINNANFTLSNRAFKVALVKSTKPLTVQNPFTSNSGKPISGYIDMVGAANNYGKDLIFGFEELPARNSASEAVRRVNLIDTDDNSTDFIAARYAKDGMSKEEIEVRKPRNSSAGKWNPFAAPEQGEESLKLMILQVGAATDGNVSHTFIELYNNTSQAITLNGAYSLQYAAGTKVASNATEDGAWTKIDLTGTIQPHCSFLILGKKGTLANPKLSITDDSGDINESDIELSNRAGKVVLMNNQTLLTVQNPFDNGGQPVTGYVDMIGYYNDNTDQIFGYETEAIKDITKQAGARRKTLDDTDDNSVDFEKVAYNNATDDVIALKRPKNLTYGAWHPITGEKL